jgi:hypothetical protein
MTLKVSKWILALLLALWIVGQVTSAQTHAASPAVAKSSKSQLSTKTAKKIPARKVGPDLSGSLGTELEALVAGAGQLHLVLLSKNEKQIQAEMKTLSQTVRRAIEAAKSKNAREPASAGMMPTNHRKYLTNMLTDMAKTLDKSTAAKSRPSYLQDLFKHIVQVGKMYQVKGSYQVFFCAKDKSVWVQKGNKPQNPFADPSCARRVLK